MCFLGVNWLWAEVKTKGVLVTKAAGAAVVHTSLFIVSGSGDGEKGTVPVGQGTLEVLFTAVRGIK